MPELPEVEVLVRHLAPLLTGRTVRGIEVRRAKVVAPTSVPQFRQALVGAQFRNLFRRGKYLVFELSSPHAPGSLTLVGHLGMTGRLFVARRAQPRPKHAAVIFDLGQTELVFEDTRYFGRLTFDTAPLARLGPEPLNAEFTANHLQQALKRSAQPIKTRLLDQSLLAGVGNIYASEALYRARLSPRRKSRSLTGPEVHALWRAIRDVLAQAITWGSTVPLHFGRSNDDTGDRLFYFGRSPGSSERHYTERLRVYDCAGRRCPRCGTAIRRIVQNGRSTFYCPACQR